MSQGPPTLLPQRRNLFSSMYSRSLDPVQHRPVTCFCTAPAFAPVSLGRPSSHSSLHLSLFTPSNHHSPCLPSSLALYPSLLSPQTNSRRSTKNHLSRLPTCQPALLRPPPPQVRLYRPFPVARAKNANRGSPGWRRRSGRRRRGRGSGCCRRERAR